VVVCAAKVSTKEVEEISSQDSNKALVEAKRAQVLLSPKYHKSIIVSNTSNIRGLPESQIPQEVEMGTQGNKHRLLYKSKQWDHMIGFISAQSAEQ
jgi:hypothetical protein